jgi:hypothetical protein
MSKDSVNVYWAVVVDDNYGMDRQLMMDEPETLRKIIYDSRNKENKVKQNFLKCPAVTAILNNTLVWKAPKNTSVDIANPNYQFDPRDPMPRYRNGDYFDWYSDRPQTIQDNVLITFDYHIIFFSDEELDVMFTAPYFSQAPHLQYGSVVPGIFNVGSWFRPMNAEFNLWDGNTYIELKENEPIAYFNFLTEKKINLQQFRMTEDLYKISRSVTSSIVWLPNRPLRERYELFKRRRLRSVILNKIKENLV